MGRLTTPADQASAIRSGEILSAALAAVVAAVKPGVSTAELDSVAASAISTRAARPAFTGYNGYPAVLCASINDEVVHGIPSPKRHLAEGDIVGLDLGVIVDGWHTDMAVTVPVGRVSADAQSLIDATRRSLAAALKVVRPGATVGDIGAAVQASLAATGFSIVRDLVGHGIGKSLHEEPQIPNVGRAGTGPVLEEGQLIAIEPMITAGKPGVQLDDDHWTFRTKDGSLAAHFEQTVLITKGGCRILTPFDTLWQNS